MQNEESEFYLTDIIDTETLQSIQDAFSRMTGMASLTTDHMGKPVTKGSNFTDFCMKYTRETALGFERCQKCDKYGAEKTHECGSATTYVCHAGLIDFAAPIIIHDKMVGCFIGGQVLSGEPDLNEFRRIAKDLGIDEEEYVKALSKIPVLDKATIDRSAEFLCELARVISDMVYGRYIAIKAKKEMEKALRLKSDFLANMSHEIRTPMNAVIGMAEMALREELPPMARDYILQIKESGKSLLTIINDILDFSKIESGKMDISVVEYEPMSVINDIVSIINTRLRDKDLELILNIAPDLPNLIVGDNIRIKQVLLNLINNAVKFTEKGRIEVDIHYKYTTENEIELSCFVEDTGIGIKQEDFGKLFQSFQQVDSKRNREIEGTGLGLAISEQLLHLMNGKIWVESEYGKGTRFSFCLPQRVIDSSPSISVDHPEKIRAAGYLSNEFVREQMKIDCANLKVKYLELEKEEEIWNFPIEEESFLFIEEGLFSEQVETYVRENPDLTVILLTDYFSKTEYHISNMIVVKKPLYILNLALIFRREDLRFHGHMMDDDDIDFIAPEAEILVVDDNAINLTVVEGLLEPLKMQIDTALSGKEAISKISVHKYDIVFMDHMMPELDGIEATHIIRRFHSNYNEIPIIALTANAVDGMKEMFLREGMNDFIAKPIELRIMVSKIKQWLPVEKIQRVYEKPEREKSTGADLHIADLDTVAAVRLLGSEKLFMKILEDYYHAIEKKAAQIRGFVEKEDWANYTIEVHSLKSTSKQIGAMMLSKQAAELEKAGNARDTKKIRRQTEAMLERYEAYLPIFAGCFPEEEPVDDSKKEAVTLELLQTFFSEMRDAVEELDMDHMEEVVGHMEEYLYEDWQNELFDRLKEAVDELDVDTCESIIEEWEGKCFSFDL